MTDFQVSPRVLANGVTVLLEPIPFVRSASAGVWIRTGSSNETPALSGVSHLLEHLLFKGTSARTARQIVEGIESRGGYINASTSRDYTNIYVKTLDTNLATALDIMADVIKDSQLLDFDKERNVVLEEIASSDDVPDEYVHDLFSVRFWPEQAMGRPIAGTQASVEGLTLDQVRAYYRSRYTGENIIVSIAGSFDEAAVLAQVEALFSDVPASAETELPKEAAAFGAGVYQEERDITQQHVIFGFPGVHADDSKRFIYELMASTLGGGFTSRLFSKIREDAGLAYSIYAFNYCYCRSGMLGVYAAVAPENLVQATDLAFGELRDVRENLLSDDELAMNKEQLKGSFLMALESTFSRMTRMAKSILHRDRVMSVEEIVDGIDAVTAEAVRDLAQDLFQSERCMLTALGPEGHAMPENVSL
jgi:predicted Zn-dependent peptidase